MLTPHSFQIQEIFLDRVRPDVWSDATQEVFSILLDINPEIQSEKGRDEAYALASDLVEELFHARH